MSDISEKKLETLFFWGVLPLSFKVSHQFTDKSSPRHDYRAYTLCLQN